LTIEARRLFRRRTSDDPELKRSKRDAMTDMIEVWDIFSGPTLEAGWALYQNEEERSQSEDP
jgi:hypothetical protein